MLLIKKNKISFLLLSLFLMWGLTAAPIQSHALLSIPTMPGITVLKVTTCPKVAGAFNVCQLTKIQYVINQALQFRLAYLGKTFIAFLNNPGAISLGYLNTIFKPPRI